MFNFNLLIFHKLIFFLFYFILLILSSFARPRNEDNFSNLNSNKKLPCLDSQCVIEAAKLIQNLNTKIDPCEDFFNFSCGSWIENNFISEHRTSISMFQNLRNDLNTKIRVLLENQINQNSNEYMKKAIKLYNACMNTTEIEQLNNDPLLNVLKQVGGWPVLMDDWNENKFDWVDMLIKFNDLGFSTDVFYDIDVNIDFQNNTQNILMIDQTSLGMPDSTFLLNGKNSSTALAYYDLMINSAKLLGAKGDFIQEIDKVFDFEVTLAKNCVTKENRRNYTNIYNKITIDQISKLAPNTDWKKFFTKIIGFDLRKDEPVIVIFPNYLITIDELLSKSEKKTIANYLVWRLVLEAIPSLNKQWINLMSDYHKVLIGQKEVLPRWEKCVEKVISSFGIGVSASYVNKYFNNDSKKKALTMIEYLKTQFINILKQIDWMDEKTLKRAIIKAEKFQTYVGYPDELLNDTIINQNYFELKLNSYNYFGMLQEITKFRKNKKFKTLYKSSLENSWEKHALAAQINAFNYLDLNSIEIPAGILQSNFFNANRPNYLNFGAIGFVIGHEISHSFDDAGKQFDENGNNVNWWEHETDLKFRKRVQCLIEQYGNFTDPVTNTSLNGKRTQGENIADNAGIKESFMAYQKWVEDFGEELPLPGLNYTNNQLFFISYANIWCSKVRPERLKTNIIIDDHSPMKYRLLGTLQNSKEFSQTFNCKLGSKMNPSHKCTVW